VPSLQNVLNWIGLIGRQERGLHSVLPNPRQMARMRRALRKIPLQAADVGVAGAPVSFWRDFTSHAGLGDEFWAGADHDRADLTRLPPVSMVTGWWDLFVPLQLRDSAGTGGRGGALPYRLPDPGRAPDPRAGQRGRVPALRSQLRHRAALCLRHQRRAMPVRDLP
jgi:uncharacterized protein